MDKGIEALIGRMLEQTKRFDNVHITESEAKQLITELKRLDGRNANLNSTLESWATDRAESAQRIAELESAPGGMMQLSNELADMKRKYAELQEQKDKWSAWAIALGAKADELESRPLCVKSDTPMREAAPLCVKPLCVKLPDYRTAYEYNSAGFNEALDICADAIRDVGGTVEGE